jgi:hypothetical protein
MAYLDEPLPVAQVALVADLDLLLKVPGGRVVYGNMRPGSREERFATVERILLRVPELPLGDYEVAVSAHGSFSLFPEKKGAFSLVVVGPIDAGFPFEETRGSVPACPGGQIGSNCQIVPTEITDARLGITIAAQTIEYFVVRRERICRSCRIVAARSPLGSAPFRFLFHPDEVPVAPIDFAMDYDVTDADVSFEIGDAFENISSFVGVAVVNLAGSDFGLFIWVDDPNYGYAPPRATRSPRVIPTDYYVPMMVAYVMLGVLTLAIFVILVCILSRND